MLSWSARALVLILAGIVVRADTRIRTPLQMVPLWSDEMLSYVTGEKQAPCSGTTASRCERLNTGVCDGAAYFAVGPPTIDTSTIGRQRHSKQTDSANPQYFALDILGAGMSGAVFDLPRDVDRLELVFNCSISGNDACPTNRFQTAAIRRVELAPLGATERVDVTQSATIRPDGPIVIPIGQALKQSLLGNPGAVYQVRAVAECFSAVPTPVEWELPLYESPSVSGKRAGSLIARVMPGQGIQFMYRRVTGDESRFEPDWVEPDWGYTFMMDQTILDRTGDWFQLPARPFPRAVWIQLPGRKPSEALAAGSVYTLTKSISARSKGAPRATVFDADTNIVIVSVRDHAVEIRIEQSFDTACSTEERPSKLPRTIPTYVVDADGLYDGDLHLILQPAYPKGC
jgi:hypothetical protein